MSKLRKIAGSFNLFNDGRDLTSTHRDYVLAAVKGMVQAPRTLERIKLREAIGYAGHKVRELSGKMAPGEKEPVMVNGKPVVMTVEPACLTSKLDVDDDGTVSHEQELALTDAGRYVGQLYDSDIGGWSWACDGADGGAGFMRSKTRPRNFFGFDWVNQPGFALNRNPESALILESLQDESSDVAILESLQEMGVEPGDARAYLQVWAADEQLAVIARLRNEQMILESIWQADADSKQGLLDEQIQTTEALRAEKEVLLADRRDQILEAVKELPVFVGEDLVEKMAKGETDVDCIRMICESVRSIDQSQLPLSSGNEIVPAHADPVSQNKYRDGRTVKGQGIVNFDGGSQLTFQ